ncbi:MAG: glycosyltransferase family 9 protein [Bacteroidetes bacterium]|nr:glycosyltransferase family 9 protein [Bacteroidota bacterium]
MKVLVIRFSSIGDIVLTTPVVRCLKNQVKGTILHYATKEQYLPLLSANPYIDKVYTIRKDVSEIIRELKKEKYDFIVDLHKNIRSHQLRFRLWKPSASFPKLNFEKGLMVKWKINRLPDIHIVDRYFQAVKTFGITNDGMGLDLFILSTDQLHIPQLIPELEPALELELAPSYIAFCIGGKFHTKIFPAEKVAEVCSGIRYPVILLGGPEDHGRGQEIIAKTTNGKVFNLCGKLSLMQSASVIRQSLRVITNDTGMMHFAAALRKDILSLWGNTIPAFGMYPYFPEGFVNTSAQMEVNDLSCRPCSRLGYQKCPKGHFDCMGKIPVEKIINWATPPLLAGEGAGG